MIDDFVLRMDSREAMLARVGGKGANLSRMTRAGFPVPPGFLITTNAYNAFVQGNALQTQIVALARDPSNTAATAASAISQLFAEGSIPPAVAASIEQAYGELAQTVGDVPAVAGRSSATAEDLPGASFAGQQESYLNLRGEAAVLDAVQRCWASLWTARAIAYRARQNIDPARVSLAIVVQVMVPAAASGIMFTANPLSGVRDELVIDAAWGLGEAIVGGLVTPDHVVVDKVTGAIKQSTIADKEVMTVRTATGTEERPVEEQRRRAPVLETAQVAELGKLGAAIEAYYGEPQDIEWCLAADRFWIVQSRPITTLPTEPVLWKSPLPGAKWIKDLQAGEWATEPLSPLGATTTFAAMIAGRQRKLPMQRAPWSTLINGWLYVRADFRLLWLAVGLKEMGAMAAAQIRHKPVRRRWPEQLALLDSLERSDLPRLTDTELQSRARALLRALGWWWWEISLDAAIALLCEQLIGKMGVSGLDNPSVLFRGNDSLLLMAERALREAARTGEVESYLGRFGHFVESADPIHPTLRESPDLVAQLLSVSRQSEMSPDERLLRTRRERAEAEQLLHGLSGSRGLLARMLIKLGQSYAAQVDDAVFHFQRVLALVRATFLQAGRRLVRAGVIEQAEDIFYLQRREIWAPEADFAARVTRRRLLRERHMRLAPPPYVPEMSDPSWDSDRLWKLFSSALGATVLKRGAQERNGRPVLVGTSGSPGRVRGIARVIAGPDDFNRLQPGDILVARTTSPIWTPLFNIAGAAVTEVGGPFSHAAIVAREFGIPLVNGALDATQVIVDGTSVVVDGSAGIVELLDG